MSLRTVPLERWGSVHAALMMLSPVLVHAAGHPSALALVAAGSFAALLVAGRGRFTERGTLGAANAVTLLRLALVLALGSALHGAPARLLAAGVLLSLALDVLDGWVARRAGSASAFGACFDVEVDALLVLVLGVELWQSGRCGGWILAPGLLRYAYVLALALRPSERGPQPRTRLGRVGFVVLILGLLGALVEPGPLGTLAALLGTVLVTLTFVRAFHFSWGTNP